MTRAIAILCAPTGSEWTDVLVARERLKARALDAFVVSTADDVDLYSNLDHRERISVDLRLEQVEVAAQSGVLLAGGLIGPYNLRTSAVVSEFVDATLRHSVPLAASGHGVWLVLGSAHIHGRKLCAPPELAFDVRRSGADLVETDRVHADGYLASSAGRDEIDGLCQLLARSVIETQARSKEDHG